MGKRETNSSPAITLKRIMQIEVEEKIVYLLDRIRAQAASRSVPFDAYLEQFVELWDRTVNGVASLAEFDLVLDELAAQPCSAPSLPADFSRADIYADHD